MRDEKNTNQKYTVHQKAVTGNHMVISIYQSTAVKVTYKLKHSNFPYKNTSSLIMHLSDAKC